ncbi:hypothetical protein ACLBWC_31285, partial [Pseudomonas aeruginosa]
MAKAKEELEIDDEAGVEEDDGEQFQVLLDAVGDLQQD